MIKNPKLFEINSRVWIKNFGADAKLRDIPESYIKYLSDNGFNIVWLMGIWQNCNSIIEQCCFNNELTSAYSKSLKDWTKPDVIGSPYSINKYEITPLLGNNEDLAAFRQLLAKYGIKLILDFVSNHFGAGTELLDSHPYLFLQADSEAFKKDPFTFFEHKTDKKRVFAHGRDPLFPAWTDTVQINYYEPKAREYMIETLENISDLCDGVRCDMAMLPLNNVFNNTWLGTLNKLSLAKPDEEFWRLAINKIKEKKPEFIFLGEAYWDLEWELQQCGFDFTYDKKLTDRLATDDVAGVNAHLKADFTYQKKSARFLENHDEPRAVARFSKAKSLAAAVVTNTIIGMKFFFDGQLEGKRVKLPIQLSRAPIERVSNTVSSFYKKLLAITKDDIFRNGRWVLLTPEPSSEDNNSFENFFAWWWIYNNEFRIIVVNYSDQLSQCKVKIDVKIYGDNIEMVDLLTGEKYVRSTIEMKNDGLFVELKPFQSHIFAGQFSTYTSF